MPLCPPSRALYAYFRSGWAFLIPYLTAYLLYAWLKWPVNEWGAGSKGTGGGNWIPPLLHVYWVLHVFHLILGAIALRAWRNEAASRHSTSGPPSPASRAVNAALPWVCLALLFYIPGLYLEWPSDPWEHLRRINEWRAIDTVTAHSCWTKSSYFLPYSLTGHATGFVQLGRLNVYYTAACLLLSWQYYRLALAAGLRERAAFVFVLLNALTFGNNVFSFYRYYGLSSSIFAQLGTVALIRIALDTLRARDRADPGPARRSYTFPREKLLPLVTSAGLLFIFTAFNHAQGLGLVALCFIAVGVWWCVDRYHYRGWGTVIALAMIGSALFVWLWPRSTSIENLRAQGWLNSWYGFNLLGPSSPAWNAMLQVLGGFGVLNMLCGVWLLRRNHPVGWLTFIPWIALQLPFISIPVAQLMVSQSGEQNILIVQRLFFSIAAGLAIVVAVQEILSVLRAPTLRHPTASFLGFALLAVGLAAGVCAPVARPSYNRFWQIFAHTPNDQWMEPVLAGSEAFNHLLAQTHTHQVPRVLTTSPTGFILANQYAMDVVEINRRFSVNSWTPTGDVIIGLRFLATTPFPNPVMGLLLEPSAFFSSQSIAGFLSGHWLPQESALTAAGTQELLESAKRAGFQATPYPHGAPNVQFLNLK